MFTMIRLALIFLFGGAAAAAIEESPTGAFAMGALSLAMTVWVIYDATQLAQRLTP